MLLLLQCAIFGSTSTGLMNLFEVNSTLATLTELNSVSFAHILHYLHSRQCCSCPLVTLPTLFAGNECCKKRSFAQLVNCVLSLIVSSVNWIQSSTHDVIKNLIINSNIAKAIYNINYNRMEFLNGKPRELHIDLSSAKMTILLLQFYEVKFSFDSKKNSTDKWLSQRFIKINFHSFKSFSHFVFLPSENPIIFRCKHRK